jgi:hypothetical protein
MGLADRYGTERGPVTDICLPKRLAHNMPAIHAPLLLAMAYLPARTLTRPRGAPSHVNLHTDWPVRCHSPAGGTRRPVPDARTAAVSCSTG